MDPGKHVVPIATPAFEAHRVEIAGGVDHRRPTGTLREFDREERSFDRRGRVVPFGHEVDPTAASGSTENIADSAVGTGPSRSIGSTAPRS